MITHGNSIKLFAGNSCKKLAAEIAKLLNMELGEIECGKFSDGETMVNIHESVRGRDVFVLQSTSTPVNDNLMELLVIIDALRRASAGRITAVMPYFGYARQDRKARSRDPITAKLVADLITTAGADRVLTMDLHASQLQGFFDIPVDHLLGAPVITNYFLKNNYRSEDLVIVSPDVGSVKRARNLASKLDAPIAIIDKRRPGANAVEIMNIIGDVRDKSCIMVDDMIDTAGTIVQGGRRKKDHCLLYARRVQRSRVRASGKIRPLGDHCAQHHRAPRGAPAQDQGDLGRTYLCRGNREDLRRSASLQALRIKRTSRLPKQTALLYL